MTLKDLYLANSAWDEKTMLTVRIRMVIVYDPN